LPTVLLPHSLNPDHSRVIASVTYDFQHTAMKYACVCNARDTNQAFNESIQCHFNVVHPGLGTKIFYFLTLT